MLRREFYDEIRSTLFAGHLTQPQVDGLELLLDEGEKRTVEQRSLAYVLATVHHETARTMQPIREFGLGRGHDYGVPDPDTHQAYYGRGFVQLTHKANYQTMSTKLGVDLVADADRALDPTIAASVLFVGMTEGLFTGRKLADFFGAGGSDWYNARKIVNGLDRAQLIAGYGLSYYKALLIATQEQRTPVARIGVTTFDFRALSPQVDLIALERDSLLSS